MTQPPQPPNQPNQPNQPPHEPDQPPSQQQQSQQHPQQQSQQPGGQSDQAPQPPAPPRQQPGPPPQGGFGAPIPPPQQPGYGHPQTPPGQQPGYGYPQAPPGYGFPQAASPSTQPVGQQPHGYGYGYPTQPVGQQPYGYGYPTQPTHPQYGPQYGKQYGAPNGTRPGGGRRLSTQARIILAAVVAVVLIIGAGVWFAATDGDDRASQAKGSGQGADGGEDKGVEGGGEEKVPSNTTARVAFRLPQPKVTDVTDVGGSWVTDELYVKTGINSVVGYDLTTGAVKWTLPLPGQVCAASRHATEDHKTAIAFEPAKRKPPRNYEKCSEVGAIDLATGKLLWSGSVKGTGDQKARFTEVTLGGGTVAAGGTDGGAAFDLATGAVRWKPQANAENCYDMGYGGGPALVAVRKCGAHGSRYVVVQSLNPRTGAPLSSFRMPAGVEYASVVSTRPLVVAADVGDTAGDGSGISDFFVVDEKTGKLTAKISADADRFAARCGSTEVESCRHIAVGNNRLYLPTEEHEGSGEYGDTNEIVSFDLATGKPTADKAEAGDRYTLSPLRMDGGNIIAYKRPPYDKGGQIVSIDGGTFEQTLLLEIPSDDAVRKAESGFGVDYSEILYSGGRLFLAETMLSKPSGSVSRDEEYLVLALSTG
ncbi:PQQ-binding-like beta-propeller repeat protein [Streptomyces sp. PKU-MA01144]|uniref:outer membrane protein assembly factor BamB family protein n=1 Tax=Streptomyces sp. PKU-MA01144 TaxID=2729138 RepID=UPI001BB1D665|nr:PQQ-binding-like beta-propeller repeat protein [Streptomyces sp. PKU-MA01144]